MAALLVPTFATGGTVPAEIDSAPNFPVRYGDTATYHLDFPLANDTEEIGLFVAGNRSCMDGFERTHTCLDVRMNRSRSFGNATHTALVSKAHAEALSHGEWALEPEGVGVQTFAGPFYQSEAFPVPFPPSIYLPSLESHRVILVGAVETSLRLSEGQTGTFDFAGHPVEMDLAIGDATTSVTLRTEAPNTPTTFRYTSTFTNGEGLPTQVTIERVTTNGSQVFANATRETYTPGRGEVDVSGWSPLEFPQVHPDTVLRPWGAYPPSAGEDLLLPIDQASRLAELSPANLAYDAQHSDSYVAEASYAQTTIRRGTDLAPGSQAPILQGRWSFVEDAPESAGREVDVIREIPQAARSTVGDQRGIDRIEEDLTGENARFVPPRSQLPDRLTGVDHAIEVTERVIPFDRDSFSLAWGTGFDDVQLYTAGALVYQVECGTPQQGPSISAFVSAVNGQLMTRRSLGGTSCNTN